MRQISIHSGHDLPPENLLEGEGGGYSMTASRPADGIRCPILPIDGNSEIGSTPQTDVLWSAGEMEIQTPSGPVWVSGNSVLCACPSCDCPMSVRIWLMVAQCWSCEITVELSEEQLAAARRLNQQKGMVPPTSTRADATAEGLANEVPALQARSTVTEPETLDPVFSGRRRWSANLVRRGFRATPAWLVSFLLHLMLILILALILLPQLDNSPSIIVSTFISPERTEGGEIRIEDPEFEIQDDLALAQQMVQDEEEARKLLNQAKADAAELQEINQVTAPDLERVKQNISTTSGPLKSLAARDPRVRSELVKQQGGTTFTEAAVSRGLRWLASVQNSDGSWSLARYHRSSRENNPGDMAGTSLALLPFLGAGQTHESGKYRETVTKGLLWILNQQAENGDLRDMRSIRAGRMPENAAMYAHGQASIVLVEAFAMTGDESLRSPCQRAIEFIEKSQHEQGGWRYQPKMAGDTSVFGWQLMALQSARGAQLGLQVDRSTMDLADQYLDRVSRKYVRRNQFQRFPAGALYRYQTNENDPSPTMTAEALLCRMYLGWDRNNPALRLGVDYLLDNYPPDADEPNIYYWYYATQALHHFGGRRWESWNLQLREILIRMQQKKGRYPGSWDPSDFEWGPQGGRIFVTSLSICTLEVYYRHLPLFEKIELD